MDRSIDHARCSMLGYWVGRKNRAIVPTSHVPDFNDFKGEWMSRRKALDSDSNDVQNATNMQATTQLPTAATAGFESTFNGQVTSTSISLDRQDVTESAPYSGAASGVDTYRIKVWQGFDQPGVVKAKFWVKIPIDNRRNPDFTIAERQAFLSPCCDRPINLPRSVLVKVSMNGSDDGPSHHAFPCPKCASEVNVTAEW